MYCVCLYLFVYACVCALNSVLKLEKRGLLKHIECTHIWVNVFTARQRRKAHRHKFIALLKTGWHYQALRANVIHVLTSMRTIFMPALCRINEREVTHFMKLIIKRLHTNSNCYYTAFSFTHAPQNKNPLNIPGFPFRFILFVRIVFKFVIAFENHVKIAHLNWAV